MSSPLIDLLDRNRSLHGSRPVHLTLGVRRSWLPLFRDDPRADAVLTVERPGKHGGPGGVWRLARTLRRGRFDGAILGPPSLRAALVAALAGIPLRAGYRGDGRRLLLRPGLPAPQRGRMHYSREMTLLGQNLLAALGRKETDAPGDHDCLLPGVSQIEALAGPTGCRRWVLAPGVTYGLAKTWPLGRAAEFCRLVMDRGDVELILLGDAAAGHFARELADLCGCRAGGIPAGRPGLVDLTGKTSLTEAVAVLKSAQAFVGNDSGLMHLAGALGVATVGIFGSSNPLWTAPLGPRTAAVAAEGFACRPCYRKTCNQPNFCLETIGGPQVLDRVDTLLEEAPAAGKGSP